MASEHEYDGKMVVKINPYSHSVTIDGVTVTEHFYEFPGYMDSIANMDYADTYNLKNTYEDKQNKGSYYQILQEYIDWYFKEKKEQDIWRNNNFSELIDEAIRQEVIARDQAIADALNNFIGDNEDLIDRKIAAAINQEVINRNEAITIAITNVEDKIDELSDDVDERIRVAIEAEDTKVQNDITDAIINATNTINQTIADSIAQEVEDRNQAIDDAIAVERQQRIAADEQEVIDRNQAIADAINQEVIDRNEAITNAVDEAIAKEVQDRDEAIATAVYDAEVRVQWRVNEKLKDYATVQYSDAQDEAIKRLMITEIKEALDESKNFTIARVDDAIHTEELNRDAAIEYAISKESENRHDEIVDAMVTQEIVFNQKLREEREARIAGDEKEKTEREEADATLLTLLNKEIHDREDDVDNEKVERQEADAVLLALLNKEVIDRNSAINTAISGEMPGNAASSTKLKTGRKIGISGAVTGTPTLFDGTTDITIPTTALDVSKATAGTLPVARGGTGVTTIADIQAGKDANGDTIHTTYAKLNSPTLTGTPNAPTPAVGTNNTQIATTAFVESEIDRKIAVAQAMIYKGVVKSNSDLPASHQIGWTYVVQVAGTYAEQVCEVGDYIICNKTGTTANNAEWDVLQKNINGAVTGPASAVSGHIAVFDGSSGKIVKDSGLTIATSVPANAVFTDTKYTASTGLSLANNAFSVKYTAGTSILEWGKEVTLMTLGDRAIKAKLPDNPNTDTDTLMTQNVSTTNNTYPILLTPTANATANQGAKTGIFASGVKVNPSTKTIYATTFSGNATSATTATTCSGNAATATKLASTVKINGTDFNGSTAITTASWGTARTITISDNSGTNTQAS